MVPSVGEKNRTILPLAFEADSSSVCYNPAIHPKGKGNLTMNKYRWFVALIVLVLASMACQTVTGGGNQVPQIPQVPNGNNNSGPSVSTEAAPPANNGGGQVSSSGFPMPADATQVYEVAGTLTFQTKMSLTDAMAFYRDAFNKAGYTEDANMTVSSAQAFTLGYNGHSSGKVIYVVGADMGGTTSITITLQ
jgi:hypothetical protein